MNKKVIITGATGLIGKRVTEILKEKGYFVTVFTRNPANASESLHADEFVQWEPGGNKDWVSHINGAYGIIHLAGEPVMAGRWTDKQKDKILNSRVIGTTELADAAVMAETKPEVFVCGSAIGIYGHVPEDEVNEEYSAGRGFTAEVVMKWEAASMNVDKAGIRRVNLRTGIVLHPEGGALEKFLPPFKMFIGGPLGSGKQWFPWIHLDDIALLFVYALENEKLTGPVNGTAPNPVRMKDFTKSLGRVLHRPSFFKVPGFVLKIILGEAATEVLSGARVIPDKADAAGFEFKYPFVEEALRDLLS